MLLELPNQIVMICDVKKQLMNSRTRENFFFFSGRTCTGPAAMCEQVFQQFTPIDGFFNSESSQLSY